MRTSCTPGRNSSEIRTGCANERPSGSVRAGNQQWLSLPRSQYKKAPTFGSNFSAIIFRHMANQSTTTEVSVSKTKDEIIKEAKRIEEALLYSSKKHFVSAQYWSISHMFLGLPMVVISAAAGAEAFKQFDKQHILAGYLSICAAVLSAMMTFLNPNERASRHATNGNAYDALMNNVRMFWSIDCWREESEAVLTKELKDFSDRKDKLNQSAPQAFPFAYQMAKKGIEAREGKYEVDTIAVNKDKPE